MAYTKHVTFAGRDLKIEINRLAKQANGSVLLQYAETVVLATVVQAKEAREGADFFPLFVDYEEKMYAAGKIKGSRFIKREGRASDDAIISARLIDRSIRPLFKETERKETQVFVNVLAFDGEHDADVLGILASGLAITVAGLQWNGPLAACRAVKSDGEILINPTYKARTNARADVVVSSRGDELVMTDIEAKEAPESDVIELIEAGMKANRELIEIIEDIKKEVNVVMRSSETSSEPEAVEKLARLEEKVKKVVAEHSETLYGHTCKADYKAAIGRIESVIDAEIKADNAFDKDDRMQALRFLENALDRVMRDYVLGQNKRIDGRDLDQIRTLQAEVSVLPRVHGSAVFTRGETQVLTVATLGSPGDEQLIDTMEEDTTKRYMHHYNFPGFSVGEIKPLRMPSRREIGHGALAEKALIPVIPDKESFPYTVRLVSEVLESNGSSSQASVCGSTLALMDAGVPILRPVAGIAMGLISNSENPSDYRIITDIQGIEDHSGDMDFKVAGTTEGVTAVQLDIKLGGISMDIVKETFVKAKEARLFILDTMKGAITGPRETLSVYAPRIEQMKIHPDKIREVIGPGGKMINTIIDKTGVQMDIEDDGTVFITSNDEKGMTEAMKMVQDIVKEVEVGEVYEGKVTRIMDFGAFVEVLPKKEGLLHVSEISWERTSSVADVLKIGDTVQVKVIEIDNLNRINLSAKALLQRPEKPRE